MKLLTAVLSLFLSLSAVADTVKADDVLGYWLTDESKAVIHIYKNQDIYEGKIVWLKKIHTGEEKQVLDKENPDEALRGRSVLGMQNLSGFKFDGEDEWDSGEIYDPKSGKTYSAKMELGDEGKTLELRGYVGIPLFGRTATWTRQKNIIPEAYKQK